MIKEINFEIQYHYQTFQHDKTRSSYSLKIELIESFKAFFKTGEFAIIKMSHTKKHPYTKAKAVSKQCRNSGNCDYCRQNRTHKNEKQLSTYSINHNFLDCNTLFV